MNDNEARQRLGQVNGKLDAAILAVKRGVREAERRLTDAVRDVQGRLDSVAVPEQFDVRGYASASVAVLEAYAEFQAAQARHELIHALAAELA